MFLHATAAAAVALATAAESKEVEPVATAGEFVRSTMKSCSKDAKTIRKKVSWSGRIEKFFVHVAAMIVGSSKEMSESSRIAGYSHSAASLAKTCGAAI